MLALIEAAASRDVARDVVLEQDETELGRAVPPEDAGRVRATLHDVMHLTKHGERVSDQRHPLKTGRAKIAQPKSCKQNCTAKVYKLLNHSC